MPTVSVVIPTHNRARLVQDAVRSVLQQTYQDFEVIIVDDGSTDDTRQQIAAFHDDKRISYIRQDNRGPSAARNTGIRASLGEYVALLDDDDLWLPAKLEKQVPFLLANDQIAVVHCDFRFIDMAGKLLPMRSQRPTSRGTLYEDLMYANVIAGSDSAALIRRRCLTDVGLFDEHLQACEDQDLWRRIALKHNFGYIDEVLVYDRWHSSNLQRNLDRMATAKLRYLDKLILEVPERSRHHLPEVAYQTYTSIAFSFLKANLFDKAKPYVARIAGQSPRFLLRFAFALFKQAASSPLAIARWPILRPRENDARFLPQYLFLRWLCELLSSRSKEKSRTHARKHVVMSKE